MLSICSELVNNQYLYNILKEKLDHECFDSY